MLLAPSELGSGSDAGEPPVPPGMSENTTADQRRAIFAFAKNALSHCCRDPSRCSQYQNYSVQLATELPGGRAVGKIITDGRGDVHC